MMRTMQVQGSAAGAPEVSTARHSRLVQAAQQFEAAMLGELMKPLASSSAIGDEDGGGSTNALQSYGVESMAGALARSGALGFATRIVRAVEGSAAGQIAPTATGTSKDSTGGNLFAEAAQVPAGPADISTEEHTV